MSKTALVAIADGSEEIESSTVIDILSRLGIKVTIASAMKQPLCTFAHGMKVTADCLVDDVKDKTFDVIVYPGGMPGAEHLANHPGLTKMIQTQKQSGRLCAAICASPALGFEKSGILKGEKATCYPGMESHFKDAKFVPDQRVVVSNNVITSRGPCTTIDFAFAIGDALGIKTVEDVKKGTLYTHK